METKQIIGFLIDFYNSEKNLFLGIVAIGIVSIIVGIVFYNYSAYKVFGISLLILGLVETGVFTYSIFTQQKKIANKVETLNTNNTILLEMETISVTKMTKVYFGIKLFYGGLILLSIILINYSDRQVLNSILMALIIHLALAITIDNFAEQYTNNYKTKLLTIQ